ncbi:MAG: 16S rRNA (adenine(1518)-N(6)/adenine(1519)-N(6))-dimethyltransferase RsmA [Methanosarcinaceae archaeon]|nr:16S rRNA (adenine(1518)-N(6)/adenine(1519)-N(6))-dimethyltransferase RsmA [Methanosarcinaceae archaeon]
MVQSILRKYGIRGGYHDQHFLINKNILDRIVESAHLTSDDTVLEIGAGIGNLTERLLPHAKKVIAIEFDQKLVAVLEDRFYGVDNLEIIHGDVLDVDLPEFDKVVANLPYSISSEITFKLFKHKFKLGILMYQYEFAKRMVSSSNSKDYSRLSVNTNYFADAKIIIKVPASAFSPQPEVRSAVVELVPRPSPFKVDDEAFFLRFVTAVFSQRRKKLRNAIVNANSILGVNNIKQIVAQLPEDFMVKRAENLEPHELADIANRILAIATLNKEST